jgi:ubiquinone/menaquinone biosynthesis C-methylase UbiE
MPHDHDHDHGHDHGHAPHKFDPANVARLDAPYRRAYFPPEVYLAALAPRPGLRLADLGCGTGYFTVPVLDAVGGEGIFYAVDTSPEMLAALRERLRAHPHGTRVHTVQSAESAVPLPDGCVDAVVMGALLHELEDRAAFLAEIRRLLAPAGRLLVADWDRRPGQSGAAEHGPPYDHRVPREAAEAALAAAGYTAITAHEGFREAYLISAGR